MADDKAKTGRQDRSSVAAEQDHEVRDLAEKFDISPAESWPCGDDLETPIDYPMPVTGLNRGAGDFALRLDQHEL